MQAGRRGQQRLPAASRGSGSSSCRRRRPHPQQHAQPQPGWPACWKPARRVAAAAVAAAASMRRQQASRRHRARAGELSPLLRAASAVRAAHTCACMCACTHTFACMHACCRPRRSVRDRMRPRSGASSRRSGKGSAQRWCRSVLGERSMRRAHCPQSLLLRDTRTCTQPAMLTSSCDGQGAARALLYTHAKHMRHTAAAPDVTNGAYLQLRQRAQEARRQRDFHGECVRVRRAGSVRAAGSSVTRRSAPTWVARL